MPKECSRQTVRMLCIRAVSQKLKGANSEHKNCKMADAGAFACSGLPDSCLSSQFKFTAGERHTGR